MNTRPKPQQKQSELLYKIFLPEFVLKIRHRAVVFHVLLSMKGKVRKRLQF